MKNPFCLLTWSAVTILCLFLTTCKKQEKEVIKKRIEIKAEPFALSDVRLLEGSLFKKAMDRNTQWLLDLQPDRLLHRFHQYAGLTPKGEIYGGWESQGVSGHTLGHYLSACARMYTSTGDNQFKTRVNYIVNELAICQKARKTGYVGAIPDEDRLWDEISKGEIRAKAFELNGVPIPWYTLHKLWAGLIDAYRYTDNEQAKEVAVKLTDWAVKTFGKLTEDQLRQMLICEPGGMSEALADMYAITGNQVYLDLAEKFYDKEILDPMKENRDELAGKHSRTQIPKVIGISRLYELTGKPEYEVISLFYWQQMAHHHSYLNGGNSDHELLGEPDHLNDCLSAYTAESCNTHYMLKLTEYVFSRDFQGLCMEYYERALYNHILASQHPDDGMVCRYTPLASGTKKTYSSHFDSFWCCVGTGLENHTQYTNNIFSKSNDDGLIVNLFIPSVVHWKEKNMDIKIETQFPESNIVKIKFEGEKKHFPLYIRWPRWAKKDIIAHINGKEEFYDIAPNDYLFYKDQEWGTGVELTLEFPMNIHLVSMPDNPDRIGVFYGPVLLSAGLGNEENVSTIPEFVLPAKEIASAITPVKGKPITFTTQAATRPAGVELTPFYNMHGQRHAVYFDMIPDKKQNKTVK